jgi:hypothetical protein
MQMKSGRKIDFYQIMPWDIWFPGRLTEAKKSAGTGRSGIKNIAREYLFGITVFVTTMQESAF